MPRMIGNECHGKNGRILKTSSCYKGKGRKGRRGKKKRRKAVIFLSGGYTLQGSKCRDDEGIFVPVAQCRRRKRAKG